MVIDKNYNDLSAIGIIQKKNQEIFWSIITAYSKTEQDKKTPAKIIKWRKQKMARVKLLTLEETSGAEKERYEELAGRNAVTNMKAGLLNDAATYDAYMGWYTSWNRLVEVIGEKDAILYAHSISTTTI